MCSGCHPAVGQESVLPGSWGDNYEKRLLVLRPDALKEEYQFEEYQYFFAESGFGCDPAKLGTKVFGQFLIDGDDAAFRRGSFFGIADESKLPGWAKERLQKLTAPKNDGPAQTGVTM